MKLSIIIPTYNSFYSLAQTLYSIDKNKYRDFEVIVVDDGSLLSHKDFIDYDYIRLISLPRNYGPSYCRNRGAEVARGDILVFIDSDIFIEPDTLECIAEYFFSNDVDAITGKYKSTGGCAKFFSRFKNLYMDHNFSKLTKEVNFLLGAICAIRRESFISWDESKRFGEDTALGQELYAKGKKIHLLQGLSVTHMKTYSWKSFFKNNFNIPFHFASTFVKHSAVKQYGDNNFSHVSKLQLFSISLSGLSLLILPLSWQTYVAVVLVFLISNKSFFLFIMRKANPLFAIASMPVHYLDNIVMGFGIFFGLINSFLKKAKLSF